ncbi:MAG TPA: TAXI family TRAP transporter solute-binding subunit [Methylocystis sp.]|nr:TAXI family TRAP transporter solute-binding subunit [Methylocystis sp.]
MLGFRLPRMVTMLLAGAFLVIALILGALYLWSPKAVIRITTGPSGSMAQRFISAFIANTEAEHPRIRFEAVAVPDLPASSKALEERKVNLALVRSDVSPPTNGQSLLILRRDIVAIVLPPGSPIENVGQLSGKTVAIPAGPAQKENARALDLILSYFNVSPEAVKRVFPEPAHIGVALRDKRAAAALAVGPIGPGQVVDVVAAVAKATRGTPSVLDLDEADAIAKRFPGFEELDIPKGAFKAHPPVPDDDAKGVAVSYRFVVPTTMLNAVAGVLARSILKTKAKLMALTPMASQIEAPDPDEKNPILPIHPGVAAYLASGDQSFFDAFQTYLYVIGVPLSVLGSAIALISGLVSNRKLRSEQEKIFRLLTIGDEASHASRAELEALQREFKSILETCVGKLANGSSEAGQAAVSLAVDHARRSIAERRAALSGDFRQAGVEAGLAP